MKLGVISGVFVAAGLLAFAACVGDDPGSGESANAAVDGTGGPDGGTADVTDPPRTCNKTGAWVSEEVAELSVAGEAFGARLTPNELTVYFHRAFANDDFRIFRATRANRDAIFENIEQVTDLARPAPATIDAYPSPTPDNGALLFQRQAGPGLDRNIYQAVRNGSVFGDVRTVDKLGTPEFTERSPYAMSDAIWFSTFANEAGTTGRIARVARIGGVSGIPEIFDLGAAGTDVDDEPVPTPDGLGLYFSSVRGGDVRRIYFASRPSGGVFGAPTPVTELADNAPMAHEGPTWISGDACVLYFYRVNPAFGFKIFRARRPA